MLYSTKTVRKTCLWWK